MVVGKLRLRNGVEGGSQIRVSIYSSYWLLVCEHCCTGQWAHCTVPFPCNWTSCDLWICDFFSIISLYTGFWRFMPRSLPKYMWILLSPCSVYRAFSDTGGSRSYCTVCILCSVCAVCRYLTVYSVHCNADESPDSRVISVVTEHRPLSISCWLIHINERDADHFGGDDDDDDDNSPQWWWVKIINLEGLYSVFHVCQPVRIYNN